MIPFPIINTYGNTVAPPPQIKKIIFYGNSPMMLLSDGRLFARGQNAGQMFGDGSATNTIYTGDWVQVHTNVRDFTTISGSSFAIMNDYTIQTSGSIRGLTGGSALSTTVWTDRTSYFNTAGIDVINIMQVLWSAYNSYILMADGSLYSAGTNASGQHGYGNTTAITALTLNPNFTNIKKLAFSQSNGSETLYALDTSGNLYGCGASTRGELLQNTSISTKKTLTTSVLDFTASSYCFHCIKSDGIYVGGSQYNGQLGDGVISTNIGAVGRTTLYKIPGFSVAPTYIYNYNYMTVMRYNNNWYVCGSTSKGGIGASGTNSTYVLNSTEIPNTNPTDDLGWAIGSNDTYVVNNSGLLYGTGTYVASTDLLPGYTSNQYTFVPLSTSGIN